MKARLKIRQEALGDNRYRITLTLIRQRCGKLSGFFDAEWGLGGRQPNAEKTESTGFESVSK
ncbi:MAG: hypothetical protein ACI8UO_000856, partial [Verrucomicrobiales bacterium]